MRQHRLVDRSVAVATSSFSAASLLDSTTGHGERGTCSSGYKAERPRLKRQGAAEWLKYVALKTCATCGRGRGETQAMWSSAAASHFLTDPIQFHYIGSFLGGNCALLLVPSRARAVDID